MSVVAILPIKSFDVAKSRLAAELAPGARRALAEAMFTDVLIALRRCDAIDQVVVISSNRGAQRIAGGYGAEMLEDSTEGHNEAVGIGIAQALRQRTARALLVPGDCPLLDPAELKQLLAYGGGSRSAVIVPDRHGSGTNALLLTPPDSLTPSFGEDSCARHVELAAAQGTPAEVVSVASLALDIDTPDDLAVLRASLQAKRGGAAHTRGMLNQLQRSQA
jgi:2-phospho-L-lactate/phosphoenolpyruvate guanylyltransferase